jgi:putative Holliday junction resolvase
MNGQSGVRWTLCQSASSMCIGAAVRELYGVGRIVGLDVGERRVGVAISDASGTLARPVTVLTVHALDARSVPIVANALATLPDLDEPITAVVVGLPKHLDGTPNAMTERVRAFAAALGRIMDRPVHLQDERLTSREAERLLALREKDWRARKKRLDAAAAAIILQEYLDTVTPSTGSGDVLADPDF